jgi:IS30 family transposase
MARKPRIRYTDELKSEIWDKYKQGNSLWSIARSIDVSSISIYRQLAPTGGIRPPPRKRSRLALSLAEREEISRGIVAELSIRTMASQLDRAPSTVSREINRNGGYDDYRATPAEQNAWDQALRPKRCKLVCNRALAQIVEDKLSLLWSPEQIAGWLKRAHPADEHNQVSHETIYRSLFVQARGALKKELPDELYRSLTWDRGFEMRAHQRFTLETDIQVYFCDPQSPWQRGSNENTNRLLRQYLPKHTDLSVHSQEDLNKVARQLNERPRKTLDYETAADRFNACVASIH